MSFLAYEATDQSAALESRNQVSSTGENLALAVNTSTDHNSPTGESEVLIYASKPDGNANIKPSGEACMHVVVLCLVLAS